LIICWSDPKLEKVGRLFVIDRAEKQLQKQKLKQGRTKGKRGGSRSVHAKPGMKPLFLFFFDAVRRHIFLRIRCQDIKRRICSRRWREEIEGHPFLLRSRSRVYEPAQRGSPVLDRVVGKFHFRVVRNVETETILLPMRARDYHPYVCRIEKLSRAKHEGMIDWALQAGVAPFRVRDPATYPRLDAKIMHGGDSDETKLTCRLTLLLPEFEFPFLEPAREFQSDPRARLKTGKRRKMKQLEKDRVIAPRVRVTPRPVQLCRIN